MRTLAAGAGVAVTGSLVAFFAARAAWFTASERAIEIPVQGFRQARIPVSGLSVSALDLGGELIAVASFLVAALAVVALLARPRTRGVLLGTTAALAGLALMFSLIVSSAGEGRARARGLADPARHAAPPMLAITGTVVALIGAGAALRASADAPWLRLPEGAPDAEDRRGPDGA